MSCFYFYSYFFIKDFKVFKVFNVFKKSDTKNRFVSLMQTCFNCKSRKEVYAISKTAEDVLCMFLDNHPE